MFQNKIQNFWGSTNFAVLFSTPHPSFRQNKSVTHAAKLFEQLLAKFINLYNVYKIQSQLTLIFLHHETFHF